MFGPPDDDDDAPHDGRFCRCAECSAKLAEQEARHRADPWDVVDIDVDRDVIELRNRDTGEKRTRKLSDVMRTRDHSRTDTSFRSSPAGWRCTKCGAVPSVSSAGGLSEEIRAALATLRTHHGTAFASESEESFAAGFIAGRVAEWIRQGRR